jgi:hypothetical protein
MYVIQEDYHVINKHPIPYPRNPQQPREFYLIFQLHARSMDCWIITAICSMVFGLFTEFLGFSGDAK